MEGPFMDDGGPSRVALVTGSSSGIGAAVVRRLAEEGWSVLGVGRSAPSAEEMAHLTTIGDVDYRVRDITQDSAPHELVEELWQRHGRFDALVNNAGAHALATAAETGDEEWDRLLNVNLRAAFRLSRAAIPTMVSGGGGTIVNIASEAGLAAVPGQVAYNVSKAGLIMLTRSLAVDHAAEGIRAVSVCPGTTETPLVRRAIESASDPRDHEEMLAGSRPAGRLGKPEEIAAAVAFVVGEEATYLTGTEIVIDGGYTAR